MLASIHRFNKLGRAAIACLIGCTSAVALSQTVSTPNLRRIPSVPAQTQEPVRGAPVNVSRLREIAIPDVPLLVGGTAGYAFRLEGMNADNPIELASGFAIGRTTAPPILAQRPKGELLSLVPGEVPRINIPFPEPHSEALGGVPPMVSMVVSGGALYGVSSAAAEVYRFDFASGTLQSFGQKGTGPGQFSYPEHIAVDRAGRIYVADHDRIVRMDDISGAGWTSFGSHGMGQDQFNYITGLGVDSKGRIYASDVFANRVVKIDDMSGTGWKERRFNQPNCLAMDGYNRIYVCEKDIWHLTRLNDLDGAGLAEIQLSRSAGWKFGSFGSVTPLKPDSGSRDEIR